MGNNKSLLEKSSKSEKRCQQRSPQSEPLVQQTISVETHPASINEETEWRKDTCKALISSPKKVSSMDHVTHQKFIWKLLKYMHYTHKITKNSPVVKNPLVIIDVTNRRTMEDPYHHQDSDTYLIQESLSEPNIFIREARNNNKSSFSLDRSLTADLLQHVEFSPILSLPQDSNAQMNRDGSCYGKNDPEGHSRSISNVMMKHNSCSTLFVDSTMTSLDRDRLLRHIAILILQKFTKIKQKYSSRSESTAQLVIPDVDEIHYLLFTLFRETDLKGECAIITLIYFDRMLKNPRFVVNISNWKRILLGAIILAFKVWDDYAIWNVDFVAIFPELLVHDLNELERYCLMAIRFDVTVKASVYASYYFELRQASGIHGSPLLQHPLSAVNFERLESRISSLSETALKANFLEQMNLNDTNACDRANTLALPGTQDISDVKKYECHGRSLSSTLWVPLRRVHSDSDFASFDEAISQQLPSETGHRTSESSDISELHSLTLETTTLKPQRSSVVFPSLYSAGRRRRAILVL
jgi:hypothetical protein